MADEMKTQEVRIRYLETQLLALQLALASVKHMAGQALEDGNRQQQDDNAGRIGVRGQSVGVIAARTTNTPGTGTFRFLQMIAGSVYLTQPFAMGDVTATCVNDTGSPTIDNEYIDLIQIDGVWTALVGDCSTATPTRAPDPPP